MKACLYSPIHLAKPMSFVLLLAGLSLPVNATEINWIAGSKPDMRPAFAPVIKNYSKDGEWYNNALQGISPPYPASLRFIETQGAWYTPFNHPGMTGAYDIRGWHRRPN